MSARHTRSMLIETHDDGTALELMDGSIWYIWPGDLPTAALWLPTSEIEIREIADEVCSHTLTNLATGETVKAFHGMAGWQDGENEAP